MELAKISGQKFDLEMQIMNFLLGLSQRWQWMIKKSWWDEQVEFCSDPSCQYSYS